MLTPLDAVAPPDCLCYAPDECEGCICNDTERALRAYVAKLPGLPPMTAEQRAWCMAEIDLVEGYASRDYAGEDDAGLAKGVLCAYVDYCRDKGLL